MLFRCNRLSFRLLRLEYPELHLFRNRSVPFLGELMLDPGKGSAKFRLEVNGIRRVAHSARGAGRSKDRRLSGVPVVLNLSGKHDRKCGADAVFALNRNGSAL